MSTFLNPKIPNFTEIHKNDSNNYFSINFVDFRAFLQLQMKRVKKGPQINFSSQVKAGQKI